MTLKGSYAGISRRVDELTGQVHAVAAASLGCPTCAGWSPNAVVEAGDACSEQPGSSILARYGRGPLRGGWPPDLVCPSCGRRPQYTITIEYVDHPDGFTPAPRQLAGVPYDRA
jgi:hypothetical protein